MSPMTRERGLNRCEQAKGATLAE